MPTYDDPDHVEIRPHRRTSSLVIIDDYYKWHVQSITVNDTTIKQAEKPPINIYNASSVTVNDNDNEDETSVSVTLSHPDPETFVEQLANNSPTARQET